MQNIHCFVYLYIEKYLIFERGNAKMKSILARIKDSKGFVSLEVIAIAVIIIALAAFIMFKFRGTANTASENVNKQIDSTVDNMNSRASDATSGNTNATPIK